jgi:hypothetical protein
MPPVRPIAILLAALLLAAPVPLAVPARAQEVAHTARRFPQPVRAGDLIHRQVLRPVEQQTVLGRVGGVARRADGAVLVVIDARDAGWRGALGLGARPVAVPSEAMALLGEHLALMDLTPGQLLALPTFDPAGTAPVPPGDTIRMGLVRPFH